jgi:starch phosphorylase
LNLSILDGWWDEAYNGENGWAIGAGEEYPESEESYQDLVESQAIYQLLEDQVVPLYYKRAADDLPKGWVELMKRSMMTNCSVYNTGRMVQEYTDLFYSVAMDYEKVLSTNNFEKAKELSSWRRKIETNWNGVHVNNIETSTGKVYERGDKYIVKANVNLNNLIPDDVTVTIYYGPVDIKGQIVNPQEELMYLKTSEGSNHVLEGIVNCNEAGEYGITVRVMADKKELASRFHYGKVIWG